MKQCVVSLVIICGLFRDPFSFSQTCYVSAGLMQAWPGALSRISFFSPLSTSAFFLFFFSVSGSDSRCADRRLLAAFDSENTFSSQFREVGGMGEWEQNKGEVGGGEGGVGERGHPS